MTSTSSRRNWLVLGILGLVGCQDVPTSSTPAVSPPGPKHIVVASQNTFTRLGAGPANNCAVGSQGIVECWGYNVSGQAPAARGATSGAFTEVDGGVTHTCALRTDGVIECWGGGVYGQAPATKTAVSGTFTQLSAGAFHSCALRSDGVVECWGGQGFVNQGQAPATRAAATGTFTQVSGGTTHSCAVRSDGVVECWGYPGAMAPPTKTAASGAFSQVSSGQDYTCALRDDGVVECWGDPLGDVGQQPPTKAAASGMFTQLSAGAGHTCARRSDGVVECWGQDDWGQAPATRTAAVGTFVEVWVGTIHTCALRSDGVVECWGLDNHGQAPAIREPSTTLHLLPTSTFSATPAPVVAGQTFTISLTNPQVAGYSGAVTFSYAFDCGDGGGYSAFGASNSAACSTSAIGTRDVKGTVQDQDGDQTEYTGSVAVIYAFGGFVGSVDAPPTFNAAKAGSAVAVKFSLGGDQGLAILAAGYPKSQPIGCDATSPVDPIEETVTAGSSSLSYDANTDFYTYVWKTVKTWARSCRLLTIRLADGNDYTALFQF